MCVIIVAHKNRPTEDLLRRAMRQNPHGNGIAWRDGASIRWRKGVTDAEALELASTVPLPFVFHARIATVGGTSRPLCHPFPIERAPSVALSGAAPSVLFHNGHVRDWRAIAAATGLRLPPDARGWSDSRALAHVVASAKRFDVLRELADGSRFAVLSPRGLRTFGTWTQDEGVLLSTYVSKGASLTDWKWTEPDAAPALPPVPSGLLPVVVDRPGIVATVEDPAPERLTADDAAALDAWLERNSAALAGEDVSDLRAMIERQAAADRGSDWDGRGSGVLGGD